MRKTKPTDFSMALADYFFVFLPTQKGLSENTIRSYSDTLELFLRFVENERGIRRERLEIAHISRPVVEDFLAWLELERGSSASTRNQRRIALNGFFRYLQYRNPGYVLLCQQILSIPKKVGPRKSVEHISTEAVAEILKQPDLSTRIGKRDFALLTLLYESAARVSEISNLRVGDLQVDKHHGAAIRLYGKGRKIRTVPLTKSVSQILQDYLKFESDLRPCSKDEPLFCNHSGKSLTRAGISYILRKYSELAQASKPGMEAKKIHPHVLRHSRAVHWLEAGIDLQHIKHLLGHADLKTTEVYARINVEMKRKMLESLHCESPSLACEDTSWTADHNLMGWLKQLTTE